MASSDPIIWRLKQQSVVAQIPKESEFIALLFAVKDVLWMKKFSKILQDVLGEPKAWILIYISISENNQASIFDMKNSILSESQSIFT